jgi:hypothetical protein
LLSGDVNDEKLKSLVSMDKKNVEKGRQVKLLTLEASLPRFDLSSEIVRGKWSK